MIDMGEGLGIINKGKPDELHARMKIHDHPGDYLKDLMGKEGLIVAPGVYNAMGAQIARMIYEYRTKRGLPCTFNAVYASGWAISAMLWALPDMGFHNLAMMEAIAKYIIKSAHPLPVILDAEAGFGNYVTLTQTVEAYHKLGVEMAHLEDQEGVRRCGNLGGKSCVPTSEMIIKIESWLRTTKELGSSMQLMVRTDALTAVGGGIDEALDRGKRYMDTNYQGFRPLVLWADGMMAKKHLEKWITELRKYDSSIKLGINYSPNKDWTGHYKEVHDTPPPTYDELYDNGNGFCLIWHTILQARADMEATWNSFDNMAANGAAELWSLHERQRTHPVGDPQAMSNIAFWQTYEQEMGGEAAVKRYDDSEGYKS